MFFKAGLRPHGDGIQEENLPLFVSAGGAGAIVGASIGVFVSRRYNFGITATAVKVGLCTALGHMAGHEWARKQIDQM